MIERKYTHSFSELLDRLTVVNQKEIYANDDEVKRIFFEERKDILHDIDLYIKEGVVVNAETIHAAMLLQLVNSHIWENEAGARGEGGKKNYELTHALNADRANIKKRIQSLNGGRMDFKLNYIPGIWNIKW